MTATLRTAETFRITATAASPAVDLAIGSVASLLGIGPRQAADRLASFPSVLALQVPGPRARQLSAMLTLLGLRVRLDPVFSGGAAELGCVAMALHPAIDADCDALALCLGEVLDPQPDLRARLERPGGLVLDGLTTDGCAQVRNALRGRKDLWIKMSDPETAVFDLFAPQTPQMAAAASRLGLGPCRFSGAVLAAMNAATGRVVLQHAGPGAVLLDRCFQRFDLILRVVPRGLAGFLASRQPSRALGADGRLRLPLRVDSDLPRGAAEQFIADYATMGLEVSARLRGNLLFDLVENR